MTRTVATQGAWAGSTAYIARPKPVDVKALTGRTLADEKHAFGEKPLFSLVPPSSGMFVWVSTSVICIVNSRGGLTSIYLPS